MAKQIFTASDGTAFETLEQAEQYDAFIEAREHFDFSWERLKKASIKQYKTADGYDFDADTGHWWKERCYLVVDEFFSPRIVEITLIPSNIRSIRVEDNRVVICADIYEYGNSKEREIDLSHLYKKKENADLRLAEILEEKVVQFQKQINELRNPKND